MLSIQSHIMTTHNIPDHLKPFVPADGPTDSAIARYYQASCEVAGLKAKLLSAEGEQQRLAQQLVESYISDDDEANQVIGGCELVSPVICIVGGSTWLSVRVDEDWHEAYDVPAGQSQPDFRPYIYLREVTPIGVTEQHLSINRSNNGVIER